MEFRRRNPAGRTFTGGGFKITRPTGPKVTRNGLSISHSDHEYDVRCQGDEIWLIDDEREVGYAKGGVGSWQLIFGEQHLELVQPKPGNNNSELMWDVSRVGEIEGSGFPVRSIGVVVRIDLSEEQQAFLAMVALLGWRESDRSLFGSMQTNESFPAGA